MYSNVTPPALPAEYDSTAYPYYVLVFNYTEGTEDWYSVNLFYSATAFICCTEEELNVKYVTTENATHILSDGTRGWGTVIESVTPSITPGLDGNVYTRIYTNHNIFDTAGKLWLAADTVTAVGVTKQWLDSFWAGVSMGLCGKAIFGKGEPVPDVPVEPDEPSKEPIGWLYGHVAKEGETATHTIDGVGYVGNVLPNIESVYTPELQETYPYALINRENYNRHDDGWLYLYLTDKPVSTAIGNLYARGANYIAYKVHTYAEVVTQATWEFVKSDKVGEEGIFATEQWAMWTNTDLRHEFSHIILAASDCVCIPIYE